MKSLFYAFALLIVFSSCKNNKKVEAPLAVKKEQTILEKIANAHGFKHWDSIRQLQFTFNVDRSDTHFERTWNWRTKSNDVLLMTEKDTITYNRKRMDSIAKKTNASFTNDKFWLLAPFNLVWDKDNFTHKYEATSVAPISKKSMQKLTIVYGNKGGYTPGDAYDFYFENDFIIKEWVFRKSNTDKPSLTTTWENYTIHNGLKIALEHKNTKDNFKLYFTEVKTISSSRK